MSQSLRERIEGLKSICCGLIERAAVLDILAVHESMQAAVAMGVQPGSESRTAPAASPVPAWLQEIDRLRNLSTATDGICATVQLDLLNRIATLHAVLLSGKGEAKVPACVVRRILKNWSGSWNGWTLRPWQNGDFMLCSPGQTYTYCAAAAEFLANVEAAGNGFLP